MPALSWPPQRLRQRDRALHAQRYTGIHIAMLQLIAHLKTTAPLHSRCHVHRRATAEV